MGVETVDTSRAFVYGVVQQFLSTPEKDHFMISKLVADLNTFCNFVVFER